MGFIVVSWDLNGIYPLVNIQKTMERSTIFHGKIHYFDWAIFNSYVSHYQRVVQTFASLVDFLLNGMMKHAGHISYIFLILSFFEPPKVAVFTRLFCQPSEAAMDGNLFFLQLYSQVSGMGQHECHCTASRK
jgi:predicted transcriptional regulator with HTH domain